MAHDAKIADRVRAVLATRGDVTEKRLMGGLCFMVGDHLARSARKDGLMVRVGPAGYDAALAEPHVRPLEFGGKRPVGYVVVEREGWSTDAAFVAWVRRGADLAASLPPKANRTPSRRAKA